MLWIIEALKCPDNHERHPNFSQKRGPTIVISVTGSVRVTKVTNPKPQTLTTTRGSS